VTSRSYTGTPATPPVTYAYDTATNGVGRLAPVTTAGVPTYTYASYDAMGRTTALSQAANSQTYSMGATYNKAGMTETETYPSGRVVNSIYDAAGRLSTAKATKERQNGVVVDVKNNGNVESQTITAPNGGGGTVSMVQTYTYDQVNRRLTATDDTTSVLYDTMPVADRVAAGTERRRRGLPVFESTNKEKRK